LGLAAKTIANISERSRANRSSTASTFRPVTPDRPKPPNRIHGDRRGSNASEICFVVASFVFITHSFVIVARASSLLAAGWLYGRQLATNLESYSFAAVGGYPIVRCGWRISRPFCQHLETRLQCVLLHTKTKQIFGFRRKRRGRTSRLCRRSRRPDAAATPVQQPGGFESSSSWSIFDIVLLPLA
jgi:hypothetical protein